jgi:hypothetical protein
MARIRKTFSLERRITLAYRVIVLLLLTVSAFAYDPVNSNDSPDTQLSLIFIAMITWGVGRLVLYLLREPKASKEYPPIESALPQVSELLGGTASSPHHLTRIASLAGHPTINILSAQPTYHIFSSRWRFLTKLVGGTSDSDSFKMSYLFCAIDLQKPVPHIFIDGLSQNVFTTTNPNLWALSKLVSSRNRLPALEGNFPKYFSVYAADRNAIDALSVLTPDVMIRLRDEGYRFDYELHGTHLYIIAEPRVDIGDFLATSQRIAEEFVPQVKKLSFAGTDKELSTRPRSLKFWGITYGMVLLTRNILLVIAALAYVQILVVLTTGEL